MMRRADLLLLLPLTIPSRHFNRRQAQHQLNWLVEREIAYSLRSDDFINCPEVGAFTAAVLMQDAFYHLAIEAWNRAHGECTC